MTTTESEYITLTEAAKVLGVSRSLMPWLIKQRELPAQRFGPKAWLVRLLDVERLKEKRAAR